MEENTQGSAKVVAAKETVTWHRWFRRTNVHIAEFIAMLLLMGALLGVLCSLLYTVFGLAQETGYVARGLAMAAVAQIASLSILAPSALWLYARTTGQETVQPELVKRTARTVFLTMWMLGVVVTLIGVAISAKAAGIMAVFGFDGADSFTDALVKAVLPGLFSVAVLGFGLWAVVKKPTRKTAFTSLIVLAATSAVVLIAGLATAVVRKDAGSSSERCTYTRYLDGECSYSEYNNSNPPFDDYTIDNNNYIPGSNLY